jgi:hypothetical protein
MWAQALMSQPERAGYPALADHSCNYSWRWFEDSGSTYLMRIFTAAFAIAAGLIVLLGYFFPDRLESFRIVLLDWAIHLAAMAVLIGIYNLIAVQMEKIRTRQKGGTYGVLLVISLIITFGLGLILGPENPYMQLTFDAIIVPVEASLMAILAVTLIYGIRAVAAWM